MADIALILSKIKLYRNYPVENQLFADIFPIFRSPTATEAVISHLTAHILATHDLTKISAIVCLESRGFFFAPIIANRLNLPVVPVRKKGKLPGEVLRVEYVKDYGEDEFEIKTDAFEGIRGTTHARDCKGKKVILMDDLLGKGGSIKAAQELVGKLGSEVAEAVCIFDVDVTDYKKKAGEKLGDLKRYAMCTLTVDNIGTPVN